MKRPAAPNFILKGETIHTGQGGVCYTSVHASQRFPAQCVGLAKLSSLDVTEILQGVNGGDKDAPARLMPLVYDELRRLANYYLQQERSDHTLQPTALVHEAYLKLIDQSRVDWQNRAHFFGVAAQLMRRILVDHARAHLASKRGGFQQKLTLDEALDYSQPRNIDLIALDDALTALSRLDERQSRVVELRFFGGLTIEETAVAIGVSPATIKGDWSMAKAWLRREISRTEMKTSDD